MTARDQQQIRDFVKRRLLSVNPACSAFRLVYLNDGTQLVQVGSEGGNAKLEDTAEAIAVEFYQLASSHGSLSPGVNRFRIQALGPAPEERAIGALDIQVVTEQPARAMILESGGKGGELNPAMLPAQMVKLGLDHSIAQAKLCIDAQLRFAAVTEGQISRLSARNDVLEAKLDKSFELMERLVLHSHERKKEKKILAAKEKRKDRLVDAVEDLVPAVHEHLTGDGKVAQLINSLGREKLSLLAETLGPKDGALITEILERTEKVEGKANKRKAKREKERGEESAILIPKLPKGEST